MSGLLGLRKFTRSISEIRETLLQVERERVVHFAADLAFGQERTQFIAPVRPNYILVIDVERLSPLGEQGDRCTAWFTAPSTEEAGRFQQNIVGGRALVPFCIPLVHVLQLHA
jgi:hypothetical protein